MLASVGARRKASASGLLSTFCALLSPALVGLRPTRGDWIAALRFGRLPALRSGRRPASCGNPSPMPLRVIRPAAPCGRH